MAAYRTILVLALPESVLSSPCVADAQSVSDEVHVQLSDERCRRLMVRAAAGKVRRAHASRRGGPLRQRSLRLVGRGCFAPVWPHFGTPGAGKYFRYAIRRNSRSDHAGAKRNLRAGFLFARTVEFAELSSVKVVRGGFCVGDFHG